MRSVSLSKLIGPHLHRIKNQTFYRKIIEQRNIARVEISSTWPCGLRYGVNANVRGTSIAKWHIDSDRKKIAARLSVTFSLPLLCFPCDRTRCFPSRLAARTIARNSRAWAAATTADVLASRRPRDGYDIAGNRYAISRAIHTRVMPNINGIWIYPKRSYAAGGELYTSAGFWLWESVEDRPLRCQWRKQILRRH